MISCGADPYKQDDHGNSAMSIIDGMGQGTYQTNLLNATKNGLKNRQTNHVQFQVSAESPHTNMGVSGIEQPFTSRGNSIG